MHSFHFACFDCHSVEHFHICDNLLFNRNSYSATKNFGRTYSIYFTFWHYLYRTSPPRYFLSTYDFFASILLLFSKSLSKINFLLIFFADRKILTPSHQLFMNPIRSEFVRKIGVRMFTKTVYLLPWAPTSINN